MGYSIPNNKFNLNNKIPKHPTHHKWPAIWPLLKSLNIYFITSLIIDPYILLLNLHSYWKLMGVEKIAKP